jgi:nitroreductase
MTPYQNRYGLPIPDPEAQANEFITKLLERTSCRRFQDKPLEPGTLELLIAAAQSAPSSGMLQTWSVIALTTPEEKAKLFNGPSNQKIIGGVDSLNTIAINTAAVVLIWIADLSRLDLILNSVDTTDLIKAQVTRAEYHLKAIVDATIAAQTFFMAAETMGISGTYCGAIRQLPIEFFETEFNLPKYTFPVFGTVHGYDIIRRFKRSARPRLPSEFILHHGTYTKMENLSQLDEYNKVHTRMSSNRLSKFESRVVERLQPTLSKESIGDALRHMGFDFK